MRIKQFATSFMLVIACAVNGCVTGPPLPTYQAMNDAESLAVIADRQAAIRSVSAECDVDLIDARNQRVSLDGVLVAEPPGRVRLRAWKFGHAVFDLTLKEGKGWVVVPDEGPAAGKMDFDKMPAQRVADVLDLLGAKYFRSARTIGGDSATLNVRGSALGRDDVTCEIERRTLTPRRFVVGEEGGQLSSELILDKYALVGSVVWPMRMRLKSPSGEIVLVVREIELNGEVPPGAFEPPQRAKALP